MSRSNYNDCGPEDREEQWAMIRYQGAVKAAFRGARGQAFLRELLAALDAMPEKALIADQLEQNGAVCAIGSVGKARGIDMSTLDPENPEQVAKAFGIAKAMVREITYMNDDDHCMIGEPGEKPERRWRRVRQWVEWCLQSPGSY